jgi:hypothetical protein
MDDISGAAEVRDHGYGTGAESFENYARTIVAKRWKHQYVSRAKMFEDFRVAKPAAEENSLLDPKRPRKVPEAVPLWTIANHGKPGQIASQKGRSCAQSKITSLTGNQAANEDQLKFGPRFWITRITIT